MMTVHASAPPKSPGACLDDLLASRFLPRRNVDRIRAAGDLPSRLGDCVRNLVPDAEWRAYSDAGQIFFAVAHRRAADLPVRSATAIDVYFLDAKAAVYSAGAWEYDRKHGWWMDAPLDVSYDCEHGWWLDSLICHAANHHPRASRTPSREAGGMAILSGRPKLISP